MLRAKRLTCARAIFIGLLASSASACGPSEPVDPTDQGNDGLEDLGVAESDLGTKLNSCSVAGSSGFGAGQVLTLALSGGPSTVMLSAPAGKIQVNGWPCVNSSGAQLVTVGVPAVAVKKIVINGDAAVGEKVILDFLPGSFGSTIFSGASGAGIQVDLGAGAGDSFMMRGTNAKDTWSMGKSVAGDTYLDVTGDSKADVRVLGAENYSITLLAGDDVFSAKGGTISAAGFVSGVTTLNPMTSALTVFGGDGADTLTGGNGADTLNGGNGNDTFKTATAADGADVYIGGAGNDTMDYSSRSATVTVDIGPPFAMKVGSVDLSTLTYPGDLDAKDIVFSWDGGSDQTVTFATPADAADVVAQINAVTTPTVVAALDQSNQLVLHAIVVGPSSQLKVNAGGSALAVVGISSGTVSGADGDDGAGGENDDVTYTVENLIGGTGADVLIGSDQVNIISGGDAADTIDGYPNATCPAGGGDVLNGNAGADIFKMDDFPNCGAILNGGDGSDTADFSLRTADLTITIDATANDGDATGNSGAGEKANVKGDVEVVLGGDGDDAITGSANADELHGGNGNDELNGGAGDDTLYGGPDNDELNGGAGNDTIIESGNDAAYSPAIAAGTGDDLINGGADVDKVSYAARTADLTITLCVNAAATGAPTGTPGGECTDDDGDPLLTEKDNLVNVEWVASGDGDDTITGAEGDEVIEGGAGDDTIHGGDGADSLYGDGGDDLLYGEDGDDYVEGGAGDDLQDGGLGDGDVCISDAADVSASDPVPDCEL
ncbi:MAG: calcium-binding protein [Polyangiaceae bacterium]